MTIDEAIAKYNKLANNDRTCYPEEAQQLAEWLEELKELRVIFGKIIREIDELQNYACFPTEWVSCEQSEVYTYYAKELTKILKLAEQLKVGGKNE